MSRVRTELSLMAAEAVRVTLRTYRERAGLSQQKLARQTGILAVSISSWESGARTTAIKLSQLLVILNTLKVTLAQFETDVRIARTQFEELRRIA